ncbi:MAG: two-component system, sporulation sensor kinase D [Bacteroidia bacterium]|jgi:two-component system, sporulation sensor kinase D
MTFNKYQTKTIIKTALFVVAMSIVALSLLYTDNLAENLKEDERTKVALWAEATRLIATLEAEDDVDITYALSVIRANNSIPVIVTLEDGTVIAHRNIDSASAEDKMFIQDEIKTMKAANEPIVAGLYEDQNIIIYYENSILFTKLKLYPYAQLVIITIFLLVSYYAFSYSKRSEQNQVWVGMSKETAHQLGTPISSLMAWMELIKSSEGVISQDIYDEINNDIVRLELITERFSKIGSEPVLTKTNMAQIVGETIGYLEKRLSSKVSFTIIDETTDGFCQLNVPLFAWVLENLTKNATDAMDGDGALTYTVSETDKFLYLEVTDTGKGIPAGRFKTVFEPGFTTKKRGWGLGLSLVKRIVQNYHDGTIIVKESLPNERTTFKISLRK